MGETKKLADGSVAIAVGTAERVGKAGRSAWWRAAMAAGIGTLLGGTPALAQSATWLTTPTVTNPADGNLDFNGDTNWNPATAPGSMSQTGTATFGVSNGTSISFSAATTTLDGFTFNAGASNYTFSNSGALTFNTAGIVVNGGSASFANTGSIQFNNASTAGSAAFVNSSGGTLTFGQQLGGIDTANAGTAQITNNAGGITSFFANTTAASAQITNSSGGALVFGQSFSSGGTDTANAGTAQITNNNNGRTSFNANTTAGNAGITNNSGGATFFGDASMAGNATIMNSGGSTIFSANTTAGNATITTTSGGATLFSDASTAGNATITNNSGGITAFFDTSTASGTVGTSKITNSGTLVFGASGSTDTASAANASITNNSGGLVQFFANTTAGSAVITNNSGGSTQFNDASMAGSATIKNSGSVLFGQSGGFDTSTAGTAAITNNSGGVTQFFASTTAGNAVITNNKGGTVAFFDNSDGGTAKLINNAGGVVDFSGSSGLTGNGALNVGSLAGSGTFIVGPQQLVSVSGSLAFTSGALYVVQVAGPNAGQITVAGTATLAGTVQAAFTPSSFSAHSYDILHANGGFGGTVFGGVSTPNFSSSLSYSATDVTLNLTAASLGTGSTLNQNQQKVANAISSVFNNTGALPPNFLNLFGLTGGNLTNALTPLSGETAVGSQQTTFNAMSQFMGLLTDPFMNRGGGINGSPSAIGYAEAKSNPSDAFAMFTKTPPQTFTQRWNVWAAGFGGSQSTSGNTALGSNNTTSNIGGTAVGADYLFSPNTIAGFALAGGGTNFSVANGGTGRSDLFQMGAYVRHTEGAAYITASLAYGWQDITTNRTVTVAGFDQLRAQFDANAWSGRVEGGYRFVSPATFGVGITPYAAAQFVTFDLPGYAEQATVGLNTFALNYGAHDPTDARTELGFRTDQSWAVNDGTLSLRGRFAWAHDYDPNRSVGATFQSLPGASFTVNGASQASESALTTASIEMKWKNGWSAAATFEGEFSDVTNSYAGKGVVRYQW